MIAGMAKRLPNSIGGAFQEQFGAEAMRREIQRAGVLAALFAFGFVFTGAVVLWLTPDQLAFHNTRTPIILISFMGLMMVYELIIGGLMQYRFRRGLSVPEFGKYGNATAEIVALAYVLYLLSDGFAAPVNVMLSPLALVFFFFIILSTLRLNLALSAYTGILSGLVYTGMSLYFLTRSDTRLLDSFLQTPFLYVAKGVILSMAGVAAGYVARQIQTSIRTSIESLESQNEIITLFGQQISREVVEVMLQQHGMIGSKLMRVCVLFLDIRNFTAFAETKSPEEIVTYQNAFFRIIIDIVNQHHGIINQFLGDGCMVTFGAPLMLDNPCDNAVKTGLEIIASVENAVRTRQLHPTRVGIGIHVGDAVTGNIGSDIRQQYSITGNVVILASRLEQLNKEYDSQLLISREVLEWLSKSPEGSQAIGPVQVKGRAEEVFVYRLA